MIKSTNNVCIYCARPARYWITQPLARYSCSKPIDGCPTYQLVQEHISTCPFPDSYHSTKISEIKCFKLLHVIFSSRPNQRRYNLDKLLIQSKIQMGNATCDYCGEAAHFMLPAGKVCCSVKAPQCPSFTEINGARKKEIWANSPDYRKNMSIAMKEAQNRPEVKAKKRQTMLKLHRGDCDECIEFQKNYHNSPVGKKKNDKNSTKS